MHSEDGDRTPSDRAARFRSIARTKDDAATRQRVCEYRNAMVDDFVATKCDQIRKLFLGLGWFLCDAHLRGYALIRLEMHDPSLSLLAEELDVLKWRDLQRRFVSQFGHCAGGCTESKVTGKGICRHTQSACPKFGLAAVVAAYGQINAPQTERVSS